MEEEITQEELIELTNKASDGSITPEEELKLLKALNKGADALKNLLAKLKELENTKPEN